MNHRETCLCCLCSWSGGCRMCTGRHMQTHSICTRTRLYTRTPSLQQYLTSQRVQSVKKKHHLALLTLVHPYSASHKGPVCQANQARAAASLNGFGNWQWEQHLHTVLQINNRLLSGPMRRRKRSACSCQPLRALRQMSGRW